MPNMIKKWFGTGKPTPQQVNITITPSDFHFSKSGKQSFTITVEARKEDNEHIASPLKMEMIDLDTSFAGLRFIEAASGEELSVKTAKMEDSEWEVIDVYSEKTDNKLVFDLKHHGEALDFLVGCWYKIGIKNEVMHSANLLQPVLAMKPCFSVVD
jgi:hypothetical protein